MLFSRTEVVAEMIALVFQGIKHLVLYFPSGPGTKTGKVGRPRKTLKKGIKVRIKNKGDQARKKGRKRPKYQAPWQEHPETDKERVHSQFLTE